MKIRRIALGSLVAVPLVAAGGVGLAAYLPGMVRDQVIKQVEARTGLSARLADVSVGFGGVTLRGLSVGKQGSPQLEAREVELRANPFVAAFRGAAAINTVVARGLRVDVPLHATSSRELFRRVMRRGDASNGATSQARAGGRDYRVEGFELSVHDQDGALAHLEASSLSREESQVRARIERATLGAKPSTQVTLREVEVRGGGASQLQLEELEVAQAIITLASTPEPQVEADHAGALDAEGAATAPDDGEDAVAAPLRRSTFRRTMEALDTVRGRGSDASAQAAAEPQGGGQEPGKTGLPVLDRLAPKALLSVARGRVLSGAGEPVLEGLSARLSAVGEQQLAFSGEGSGTEDGAISWDMQLWPLDLRADGSVKLDSVPLSLVAPFLPSIPWHRPEHGRVDAELLIKTETVKRIAVSGSARVHDAAIASARIAAQPVDAMQLSVDGRGHWFPLDKRLEIVEAKVGLGEASAEVSGALEWTPEHYLIDLDVRMPPTPCTKALHSIPAALLGDLSLATWEGKLGAHLRATLDSRDLDAGELDIDIDDRCAFATVPAMADLRRFRMPFSHSVLEPDGSVFEMETGPGTPAWTYLEDISPFFVHAVLAHEDARFFGHQGFSLPHIRNAVVRNLKAGRYVVGASTITMQLVKNIFLHREKTLARKVQEVLLTWWLERVMEKRDILELYLNVIEYGPGVYGIRHGARHYFNRLPSQLSPAESVYLSTILPNPKAFYGQFERRELSSGWIDKMTKIFARMRLRNWYSPEAVEYGLRELEGFRFVPEGTVTEAREIPGTTAPLPYMRAFETEWNWEAPEGFMLDGAEAGAESAGVSPDVAP